jgi:glycosyltransferase involved in cell wall biosynthesis
MVKNPKKDSSEHDPGNASPAHLESTLPRDYRRATRLALEGRYVSARRVYEKLEVRETTNHSLRSLIRNDLAVLEVLAGSVESGYEHLQETVGLAVPCEPARLNLTLLRSTLDVGTTASSSQIEPQAPPVKPTDAKTPIKVAILSFLFNWPSTGGGNIHTAELGRFLTRAGYDVRHFYPEYPAWGIGQVSSPVSSDCEALKFSEEEWNAPAIRERFRESTAAFDPDYAIITDAWNMKPIMAEAVRDYPYFLRFQALECLCPLNNLRLLSDGPAQIKQCPRHQLATASFCHRCVEERGHHSGRLHQLERAIAGVGTPEYDLALRRALEETEAVLVLNPLTEAMLSPYARSVRVVPWGMDPERFPWPPDEAASSSPDAPVTLFMAAVGGEFIKGYHILHDACQRLRQSRTDFELVVTFDPAGRIDEFTRSVGWLSQEDLPQHYMAADICVVPTIAQEGLSRTSVEAMASGRPVIASRIGGLPFTVSDGGTGLLFESGDADDLAMKIAALLDDPPLRRRMGLAGRRRFEREFTWDAVIDRHYRTLLTQRSKHK